MRWLVALILVAAAAAPASFGASAAILFASSEDTGFTSSSGGTIFVSTQAARMRAGYPRTIVAIVAANTGAADPPTNRLVVAPFTATNVLWIHAQLWDPNATPVANQQAIIVRSPDGISRILIRQTASSGIFKVSTRNAAGTITDLATASTPALAVSTVTSLDIKIDFSATGGVQMWLGGTQVINYSGDPRTDAATTLNQVEFGGFSNGQTSLSEVIIADQDTRAMGLVTLVNGTAGATQGWTPNTFTNIQETGINDSTFVSDSTGNVLSQWRNGIPLSGSPQILAIIQEARIRKGGTGPTAFDWSIRANSTDYLAGTTTALTTSFLNYTQIWATNPNTGTNWLPGEITSGNDVFNFGVKSLP